MLKVLKQINFFLNLKYPFDVEKRYYPYVPIIAWIVSITQVLLEIKFANNVYFEPWLGFNSGYLYFSIFAILFIGILEVENIYTLKRAFKFIETKTWKVKNQLCISFRIGIVCYLYIVLSVYVFDFKLSDVQPSFLILFF